MHRLRQLAGFVFLDLPCAFDDEYFESVSLADDLIVVARQDVPSVQAARLLVETLRGRGLPEPVLLLNQYEPDRVAFAPERVGELVGVRRVAPVRADPEGVRSAANAGKFLRAECPHSPVVRDLQRAAAALVGVSGVQLDEPRSGVWKWVRGKLGLDSR